MLSLPLILVALAVGVFIYAIGVYNSLQSLKTQIKASIQEIGNQLKRQAMLLPNLENAVKGHLKHEKEVFTLLTDARKQVAKAEETGKATDIEKAIQSVNQIVPRMSIAVESNPELKSDKTIAKFMDELRDTADKLMYSRRSVIDLSQSYNVKLVTFPSNLIANSFGFTEEKGLETPMSGAHISVSDKEMEDYKSSL